MHKKHLKKYKTHPKEDINRLGRLEENRMKDSFFTSSYEQDRDDRIRDFKNTLEREGVEKSFEEDFFIDPMSNLDFKFKETLVNKPKQTLPRVPMDVPIFTREEKELYYDEPILGKRNKYDYNYEEYLNPNANLEPYEEDSEEEDYEFRNSFGSEFESFDNFNNSFGNELDVLSEILQQYPELLGIIRDYVIENGLGEGTEMLGVLNGLIGGNGMDTTIQETSIQETPVQETPVQETQTQSQNSLDSVNIDIDSIPSVTEIEENIVEEPQETQNFGFYDNDDDNDDDDESQVSNDDDVDIESEVSNESQEYDDDDSEF